MIRAYLGDSSNIKFGRGVVWIGLQHDLAAVADRLPDICGYPGSEFVLSDELEVPWVKPTASRLYGRSKVPNHLHATLRGGYVAQDWSAFALSLKLGAGLRGEGHDNG